MEYLVKYGAPPRILVDGSPHLGTDNLVRILRNARDDLRDMGGEVRFGARVNRLVVEDGRVKGVEVEYHRPAPERGPRRDRGGGGDGRTVAAATADDPAVTVTREFVPADAVVLATGHSARDVYEHLHECGVKLEAKGFAVGFRVEHPQSLINRIQYGLEWGRRVVTGSGRTDAANMREFGGGEGEGGEEGEGEGGSIGRLPVASYRLATDRAEDGTEIEDAVVEEVDGLGSGVEADGGVVIDGSGSSGGTAKRKPRRRGVYSFCMCPGGQIVPSSTDPNEMCVNGMSFSKRDSRFANSALVVTVDADDEILEPYRRLGHGVLAGLEFQRDVERRAAVMGGGDMTVPVQRLTDFVDGIAPSTSTTSNTTTTTTTDSFPISSYRLGYFRQRVTSYILSP